MALSEQVPDTLLILLGKYSMTGEEGQQDWQQQAVGVHRGAWAESRSGSASECFGAFALAPLLTPRAVHRAGQAC